MERPRTILDRIAYSLRKGWAYTYLGAGVFFQPKVNGDIKYDPQMVTHQTPSFLALLSSHPLKPKEQIRLAFLLLAHFRPHTNLKSEEGSSPDVSPTAYIEAIEKLKQDVFSKDPSSLTAKGLASRLNDILDLFPEEEVKAKVHPLYDQLNFFRFLFETEAKRGLPGQDEPREVYATRIRKFKEYLMMFDPELLKKLLKESPEQIGQRINEGTYLNDLQNVARMFQAMETQYRYAYFRPVLNTERGSNFGHMQATRNVLTLDQYLDNDRANFSERTMYLVRLLQMLMADYRRIVGVSLELQAQTKEALTESLRELETELRVLQPGETVSLYRRLMQKLNFITHQKRREEEAAAQMTASISSIHELLRQRSEAEAESPAGSELPEETQANIPLSSWKLQEQVLKRQIYQVEALLDQSRALDRKLQDIASTWESIKTFLNRFMGILLSVLIVNAVFNFLPTQVLTWLTESIIPTLTAYAAIIIVVGYVGLGFWTTLSKREVERGHHRVMLLTLYPEDENPELHELFYHQTVTDDFAPKTAEFILLNVKQYEESSRLAPAAAGRASSEPRVEGSSLQAAPS